MVIRLSIVIMLACSFMLIQPALAAPDGGNGPPGNPDKPGNGPPDGKGPPRATPGLDTGTLAGIAAAGYVSLQAFRYQRTRKKASAEQSVD